MKRATSKSPIDFLKIVAELLKVQTKATILIGGNDGHETGISLELFDSKHDKWLFSGWSLDAFGSKKSIGLGVAKDLYKNNFMEIDIGVYATRTLVNFLNKQNKTDIRFGLSGNWQF